MCVRDGRVTVTAVRVKCAGEAHEAACAQLQSIRMVAIKLLPRLLPAVSAIARNLHQLQRYSLHHFRTPALPGLGASSPLRSTGSDIRTSRSCLGIRPRVDNLINAIARSCSFFVRSLGRLRVCGR